ncbi:MAG: hypothetical protein HOC27_06700 [Phycisphaerae bacterium]|nr:hypothetical protein [Phycisphaerae bacterium]
MRLLVLLILTPMLLLTGCNKTSRLGDPAHLPNNWLSMRPKAWQVRELPEVYRNELSALQVKLANERLGQYYNFYGKFKPSVLNEIKSTSTNLDQAYLNLAYSSKAILASLTPNMHGLGETDAENTAGIAVTNNANHRMMHDDGNRFLLLDKPSMLSPSPVVQD